MQTVFHWPLQSLGGALVLLWSCLLIVAVDSMESCIGVDNLKTVASQGYERKVSLFFFFFFEEKMKYFLPE